MVSVPRVALLSMMLAPVLVPVPTPVLMAQPAAQRPVPARVMAAPNLCEELASSPTALAQAPEGLVLLRLKRELEGAMETLARNQQLLREQARQFSQVQRGVDSAMQVVVRYVGRNGAPDEIVTIHRSDSVRVTAQGRTIDARGLFLSVDSTMRAVSPSLARGMGPAVDVLVRALQPQVAALAEVAEAQLADRAPAGYLGVSLSGAQVRVVTPEGVMTSHCEYPLVESVEAGSPAERAGLSAGDTLLAFNGRDVMQQAVNYGDVLVPGRMVRVRVRKSGRLREVPVTVARREEAPRTVVRLRSPLAPRPGDGEFSGREIVTGAPVAPMPPALTTGAGVAVLAGAQFSTIDDDFAGTLDLEAGVLVLRVPPGTPAADAGLRAGEVVVRVNGQRVRDVLALQRAMAAGGDLRLWLRSRTGERVVVLRGR